MGDSINRLDMICQQPHEPKQWTPRARRAGGVIYVDAVDAAGCWLAHLLAISPNGLHLAGCIRSALVSQGFTTQGIPFDEEGRIKLAHTEHPKHQQGEMPEWVPANATWAAQDDDARWFYAGGVMYLSVRGEEFFRADSAGTFDDPDVIEEECSSEPSFRVLLDRRHVDAWAVADSYRRALQDVVDAVVGAGLQVENTRVSFAVQRAAEVLRG